MTQTRIVQPRPTALAWALTVGTTLACPECGRLAEFVNWLTLASTDRLVEPIRLRCDAGQTRRHGPASLGEAVKIATTAVAAEHRSWTALKSRSRYLLSGEEPLDRKCDRESARIDEWLLGAHDVADITAA